MRDLHSHLLPGVDDGSKTVDSTVEMLKSAKDNGVTDIMFTPHYVEGSKYISNKSNNEQIIKEIKKIAKDMGINIYLGNEVYINNNLVELYKMGEITTLNNSRYMLIELPMTTKFSNAKSIFFELMEIGIVPILAHPERYTEYYKNIDFFIDLRTSGVLMQLNYPSLLGMYGRKAKKMAKLLLKSNVISLVGSDIHSISEGKYEIIKKANKKLKRIIGEDKLISITEKNFMKVVNNEEI